MNINQMLKQRRALKRLSSGGNVASVAIPKVDDPTLQTWLKAMDANIKGLTDSLVSKQDLIQLGLVGVSNGELRGLIPVEPEVDLTVPEAVINLAANGAYSSITLTWTTPKNKSFGRNVVYRSEIDDFGTAVEIGSTIGEIYTDYVGNFIKAHYWVRTVSKYSVEGKLAPSAYAETSINIGDVLTQLNDKITSSQFTQALRTLINKIPTLEVNLQNTATDFLNYQTETNGRIDNVSQEIALVTAGTGEQFDTHMIWFFDGETPEGWTSTGGAPSVANGWIKPFINGASTDLISPPDIPFSGSTYPDVRFRIKRVGNPIWDGKIYWGADFSLFSPLNEPLWNEETKISTAQRSLDWIGDIGQIKLVLSANQDAENYYLIDWFSFGRPSPSASWSALAEVKRTIATETQARLDYQNLNDIRFASNDTEYRALVNNAIQLAAEANSVTAERVDDIVLTMNTQWAGSTEDMAGSTEIMVGHITEEIYRIEGDQALGKRIDLMQVTIDEDISAAIQEVKEVQATQNSAMAQQIETVQTQVGENRASVEETKTSIDGINAEWKIRVQAGSPPAMAGMSIGVDGSLTDVTILTNRFSVVSPSGNIAVPFAIDENGYNYLNTAIIKDASIGSAKIAALGADKITSGTLDANRIGANTIDATKLNVNSLSAITATIGMLRTKTSGARTEISDDLIQIFDSNDNWRVKIGVFDQ